MAPCGAVPISLQPLTDAHLPGMEELVADAESVRYTPIPDPPPPGFAAGWLARYRDGQPDAGRRGFAIVEGPEPGGPFLGLALAPKIEHDARQVELGYVVAPSARGRGVAAEALRRLTRWAFDDLGMLRAYLVINHDNAPSLAVARRAGYLREGVMRSLHLKDGLRVDCELWSRLPSDPEPEPA